MFPSSFAGLLARLGLLVTAATLLASCSGALGPGADWPPVAKKWFDRAEASYRAGDMEDARLAVDNALRIMPEELEPKLLSAKIALAELEYDRVISVLRGVETSDARAVRGRAHWYAGDVERAAEELENLLRDPDVRDPWAAEISRLARLGVGRKPFEVSGGLLAVTEMARAGTTSMIVPLELNGEPALGLIATGTAEAVIDSSGGAQPSWVSLRFGERVEVRDVPALAKDLSGISRQVNAPIKILLGVNVLRHLRPTFDFSGGQFVVRTFDPPPPPAATTVRLSYVRGGGMLVRGSYSTESAGPAGAFLIDTALTFPMALDGQGWKKGGVDVQSLTAVPGAPDVRQGVLPLLRLGAYDLPGVPGIAGDGAVKEREEGLGVEVDGLFGSGLFASFRVTLIDGGRAMWLEDLPMEALRGPDPMLTTPRLEEGTGDEPSPDAPEAPTSQSAPANTAPAAAKKGTP